MLSREYDDYYLDTPHSLGSNTPEFPKPKTLHVSGCEVNMETPFLLDMLGEKYTKQEGIIKGLSQKEDQLRKQYREMRDSNAVLLFSLWGVIILQVLVEVWRH